MRQYTGGITLSGAAAHHRIQDEAMSVDEQIPTGEARPVDGTDAAGASSGLIDGRRLPVLDGLRGIAVLSVMLYNASHINFIGESPLDTLYQNVTLAGWVGVDLFFVLSGFLITGILLEARERSGRRFSAFYARRFLRIFPLYYGYLLGFFVLLPAFGALEHFSENVREAFERVEPLQAYYWVYLSNLIPFFEPTRVEISSGTVHFWSLAVEEQFYLVWPLMVFSVPERRLLRIAIGGMGIALAVRLVMMAGGVAPDAIYSFTPARMDSLMAGVIALLVLRRWGSNEGLAARVHRVAWIACALVAVLFVAGGKSKAEANLFIHGPGFSVIAIAFGAILLTAVLLPSDSPFSRFLRSRVLRILGFYSYALYVFNPIVYALISRRFPGPTLVLGTQLPWQAAFVTACILCTLLIAMGSWHFYEKLFLKLKAKFPY